MITVTSQRNFSYPFHEGRIALAIGEAATLKSDNLKVLERLQKIGWLTIESIAKESTPPLENKAFFPIREEKEPVAPKATSKTSSPKKKKKKKEG